VAAALTLLVSHNAGGAAVLAAYAKHCLNLSRCHCLLSGPAVAVFARCLPQAFLLSRQLLHWSRYAQVITSTSSAETGWETLFTQQARKHQVPVTSMLDHWSNFESRFLWQNSFIWPDNILVNDGYALAITQSLRGHQPNYPPVDLVPAYYLQDEVAAIREGKCLSAAHAAQHCLYVSEPSYNPAYTAQDALENFLAHWAARGDGHLLVRLRLHPRESAESYQAIVSRWQTRLGLHLSAEPELVADLVWADAVVGCQTMAMVVAQAAGLPVFSALPASVEASALPHEGIERLFPSGKPL
jgi:hypothetical protein